MKDLPLNERLIVAADFDPRKCGGIIGAQDKVKKLAEALLGLNVIIKVNSVLRANGYDLIKYLRTAGLKVMADLKLVDIPHTLDFDAAFLLEAEPEFVTVMCNAGIDGMMALQKVLSGKIAVMGVSILTSLNEEECQLIYGCSVKAGVLKFARLAQLAGIPDLVCSPAEAEMLSKRSELSLASNTPAIRPVYSLVGMDDQEISRTMTPGKAIKAGAERLVIGRPIVEAKENDKGLPASPRKAVEMALREIDQAIEERRAV